MIACGRSMICERPRSSAPVPYARERVCYDAVVPIISTFFGIIIRMFFDDHEPAHFHAEYQGANATFDFSGKLLVGSIRSATARKLIREWARAHRAELEANWRLAKALKPLNQVAPLE